MSNIIPAVERPTYLAEITAKQIDNSDLNQFSKPPRIKIVQAQTGAPFVPKFRGGDIVIAPQLVKVGDSETPFTFTPIHFFPSWICMNPIQMKGQLKAIREYSIDPTSEVARKCKTFTKERCPENTNYELKYRETLNFIIVVEDNEDIVDMPIHMFFAGGEYGSGQSLIGEIQLRKAPRYACRFRAATSMHTGKQGQWYGLDIANDPTPWVSEANFKKYEALYMEYKKLVDSRQLEVDTDEVSTEPDLTNHEQF